MKGDFVAQITSENKFSMNRFPKSVRNARYNVYGDAMATMLKPLNNGLYGMMGNIIFVSSQNYDPVLNQVRAVSWCDISAPRTGRPQWKTEARKDICCFIIQAMLSGHVTLLKWRAPRKSKSESEMKEHRVYAHLQTNSDSVIRRSKGLVKKLYHDDQKERERRAEQPYEYQILNMVAYGSFSVKQSNFIEGNGVCSRFDNSDRRPPMPRFPERSCKPVKKR